MAYLTTLSVAQITIILLVYRCQTRSFILREEHRPGVFESKLLKKIFGPRRGEETGIRENYITKSFVIFTPHEIFFG